MNRLAIQLSELTVLLVLVAGVAAAQEKRYDGEIVAVDTKEYTFTVKAAQKGEPAEMKFHVGAASEIVVDGERKIFAELEKGDRVTVTYGTTNSKHMARRAERHHTAVAEMSFAGQVIEVDTNSHTFTVKRTAAGKVEEMKFHVSPASRLYIGAERLALVQQIKKGDEVTVHYETVGAQHDVKHVGKAKPKKS